MGCVLFMYLRLPGPDTFTFQYINITFLFETHLCGSHFMNYSFLDIPGRHFHYCDGRFGASSLHAGSPCFGTFMGMHRKYVEFMKIRYPIMSPPSYDYI